MTSTTRKKTERFRFTVQRLNAVVVPPGADRVYVYDTEREHLAFCLTSAGSKSFYSYRWDEGRPKRFKIGKYPDLSIEQARKLEAGLAVGYATGNDPMEARRQARAEITFAEVFERYLEGHAKLKKRTWKEDEQKFELHLGELKSRRFRKITTADIVAIHTRIGKTHKGAANRTLSLLSKVFSYASAALDIKIPNPCAGVDRFPENERDRFIEPEEVKPFLDALEKHPDPKWRDYFKLLLLTGARAGNLRSMRWSEIHFDRAVWEIPASKYKGKYAHTVPLHPDAIAILQARRLKAGKDAEFVFPSSTSKTGHIVEAKKAWKKVRKESGITDINLHDLRRTLGSWMAVAGAGLPVIGKQLGHRHESTTRRYARLHLDPVRESVGKALSAMDAVKVAADAAAQGGK